MEKKTSKFMFEIDDEDKKLFKAMCSRSGLNMSQVLNDFIKKSSKLDIYELGK